MKNTKGMTLIEVIISLLIISTASLIIVVGFVTALNLFTDSNHYKDVTNKQQKALVDEENKDKNIKAASVNFSSSTVIVDTNIEDAFHYVKRIVNEVEPDAILSENRIKENNYSDIYRILLGGLIGLLGVLLKTPSIINTVLII